MDTRSDAQASAFKLNIDAKPDDFSPGDCVIYVPRHAGDNLDHKDCERGTVTMTNDAHVFVRYQGELHAKATPPDRLVKVT